MRGDYLVVEAYHAVSDPSLAGYLVALLTLSGHLLIAVVEHDVAGSGRYVDIYPAFLGGAVSLLD